LQQHDRCEKRSRDRRAAQFEQAQKMMKMVAKGGLAKMMRGMRVMMPGR
jgi:signal recognition particle subunit SRP54